MHLASLLLLGFTNFACVSPVSVLDISVVCGSGDIQIINNAFTQSFNPSISGNTEKFAVQIKPNLNDGTSYTLKAYQGQPGSTLLGQSIAVSMTVDTLAEFRDCTLSDAVSLTKAMPYSWRLERISPHSGAFVRCPDSIDGEGYRLGTIYYLRRTQPRLLLQVVIQTCRRTQPRLLFK